MKQKDVVKHITAATLTAGFALTVSNTSLAETQPLLKSQTLTKGYMQLANHEPGHEGSEGKCGNGKCGSEKAKGSDGKCGAGKCGASKSKDSEGKCGSGKCGSGKCGS